MCSEVTFKGLSASFLCSVDFISPLSVIVDTTDALVVSDSHRTSEDHEIHRVSGLKATTLIVRYSV